MRGTTASEGRNKGLTCEWLVSERKESTWMPPRENVLTLGISWEPLLAIRPGYRAGPGSSRVAESENPRRLMSVEGLERRADAGGFGGRKNRLVLDQPPALAFDLAVRPRLAFRPVVP